MWEKHRGVANYIDSIISANRQNDKAKQITVYCILICYNSLNNITNFHNEVFCLAQNWFNMPVSTIEKTVSLFVKTILIHLNSKLSVTNFLLYVADKAIRNEI